MTAVDRRPLQAQHPRDRTHGVGHLARVRARQSTQIVRDAKPYHRGRPSAFYVVLRRRLGTPPRIGEDPAKSRRERGGALPSQLRRVQERDATLPGELQQRRGGFAPSPRARGSL